MKGVCKRILQGSHDECEWSPAGEKSEKKRRENKRNDSILVTTRGGGEVEECGEVLSCVCEH